MEQVVRLSASGEESSLEEQLLHVLESAREVVAVDRLHLWATAPEGGRLLYVAGSGLSEKDKRSLRLRPEMRLADAGALARAVREKTALLVNGSDSRLPQLHPQFEALQSKSFFAVPLLGRGHPLGVLVADNKHCGAELTPDHLHLLPIFALHLATAVDNAGLLGELHACGQALTEALEQQAATSEILRVISSSPADLDRVFQMILEKAAHLAETDSGVLWLHEGDGLMRCVATHGTTTDYTQWIMANPQRFQKPFYRPEPPWRTGQVLDIRETNAYREGQPPHGKNLRPRGHSYGVVRTAGSQGTPGGVLWGHAA